MLHYGFCRRVILVGINRNAKNKFHVVNTKFLTLNFLQHIDRPDDELDAVIARIFFEHERVVQSVLLFHSNAVSSVSHAVSVDFSERVLAILPREPSVSDHQRYLAGARVFRQP